MFLSPLYFFTIVNTLKDLESTIIEVRARISDDPDPLLVEILCKLEAIRDHKQVNLEKKAKEAYAQVRPK